MIGMDSDQIVDDPIHHYSFGVCAAGFKCIPAEACHHCCRAAGVTVVPKAESGSSSLDVFQLADVGLSMRVPYRRSIFKLGPY